MTENKWDKYKLKDPLSLSPNPPLYICKNNKTDMDFYESQCNPLILEFDNVNDSIKVKVLYNELMKLKTEFSDMERRLLGEINYLNANYSKVSNENKKLSDEITSIKQALYFG